MEATETRPRRTLLDRVERFGNALPDPIFIFIGIIALLVLLSVLGAAQGWSAVNPVTGETLTAQSLIDTDNLRRLLTDMPKTYTGFTPLGFVLTIMLGASVAERSGLLAALIRASLVRVPLPVLTPVVFVVGMVSTHANDAAYLVYVPLAGLTFAAAGRHPVLGIVAGYAGAAVGLSGNLFPGQYDILILSLTETGARLIDPAWTFNPLGNWWFAIGIAITFTAIAWRLVDGPLARRLGPWSGGGDAEAMADTALSPVERRGLRHAGIAALGVVALAAALTLAPGAPLYDPEAAGVQAYMPLFRSLVAFIFLLFISSGWAYGKATGSIVTHRDVPRLMVEGLQPFIPYLVLIFFAAHFVAMFGWSNLGPITAIVGAEQLRAMDAHPALLLPMLTTMSAWLDFLIASGSAKWAAMSPVATPMLMLLGVSPEMTTAAYRVGDTVTNLISPLNPYFILSLTLAQRWVPSFKLGTLLALLLPMALCFYVAGMVLTAGWVWLELPVGPGAGVGYELPVTRP
ncbi:AbgT family transporter [Sphingomonas sp.]|uniref:AbgT family transporter n=1 Tax=Sphingomonas sp. TaxID=28214 RepID=UPI002DD6B075|nr:AbgT family transporter [Sphingomonas sp.]